MICKAFSLLGLLLGVFTLNQPACATGYSLTLLPDLPGSIASVASGINNAGQVVGTTTGSAGSYQATLWNGGAAVDLGGLGGLDNNAAAINSAGQVVGYSWRDTDYYPTAVLWNSQPTPIVTPLGQFWSFAYAINDNGTAVGTRDRARLDFQATVFKDGQETYLPLVQAVDRAHYAARAINNAGLIAGNGDTASSNSLAMLWRNGAVSILDTPSGLMSQANGINEAGRIVGSTFASFGAFGQAALWDGDGRIDLTSGYGRGGVAYDINNLSQIVGQVIADNGHIHGALWDAHGAFIDLNQYLDPALVAQGWEVSNASAINDSGAIVGAISLNGQPYYSRAIVLSVNAVPEPQGYALLLAGLGVLGWRARRVRKRRVVTDGPDFRPGRARSASATIAAPPPG